MCGIVGQYNLNGTPLDPQVLQQMTNIQRHRGPDDQGIKLFSLTKRKASKNGVLIGNGGNKEFEGGLGFNRLSILDLSKNGHQPMCDEREEVFIVFNGEIYNAFQYRDELEAHGFRFRSNTDTEIILYLYKCYGFSGMLERLNGMFAICIVDLNLREIFLARDRMGIKPLYYYKDEEMLIFASEVKSILLHPILKPELDPERIDEYLLFGYCAPNGSLFKGIHQLTPGCWLKIHPSGWDQYQYWEIPEQPHDQYIPFEKALLDLQTHLENSVGLRLLSDVKVGCQLSGGIDSSLVNYFSSLASGGNMDAFSIVVDDPKLSEERWIDIAASLSKTPCHKYPLDSAYFFDNLVRATWHMDQPLNHPNSIGIFRLAEGARSQVTVLLSGEGADELFGGYSRFFNAALYDKLHPWLPTLTRLPFVRKAFAKNFVNLQDTDPTGWFLASSARHTPNDLLSIKPDADIERVISSRRDIFNEGTSDYVSNCLKYELRTYLVDLLIRQDKMTMAHSMENRVPFLDHNLVTFIRSLPSKHLTKVGLCTPRTLPKNRNQNTKILLKHLARNYFDSDFVYRSKMGFGLPLKTFFTHPRCQSLMRESLLPGIRNRGIIQHRPIETLWKNIAAADERACESLWICIAFEIWAQQFLDRKPTVLNKPEFHLLST